jgi:hypothetical protein
MRCQGNEQKISNFEHGVLWLKSGLILQITHPKDFYLLGNYKKIVSFVATSNGWMASTPSVDGYPNITMPIHHRI